MPAAAAAAGAGAKRDVGSWVRRSKEKLTSKRFVHPSWAPWNFLPHEDSSAFHSPGRQGPRRERQSGRVETRRGPSRVYSQGHDRSCLGACSFDTASSSSAGHPELDEHSASPGPPCADHHHVRRHVVVLCHGVRPHVAAGLFSCANLLQGRVDVMCRCVTATLYLSDDFRRDTLVSLVLSRGDRHGGRGGESEGERAAGNSGGGACRDNDSGDAGGGDNVAREEGESGGVRLVQVDGGSVTGLAPAETVVALLLQQAMQHASLSQLSRLGRERDRLNHDSNKNGSSGGGGGCGGQDGGEGGVGVRGAGDGAGRVGEEGAGGGRRKSERNSARRQEGWLARQPGSRGAVPGIVVSDFPRGLQSCLHEILLTRSHDDDGDTLGGGGREAQGTSPPPHIMLLDIDGAPLPSVLERFVSRDSHGGDDRHRRRLTFIVGDNIGIQPDERALLLRPHSPPSLSAAGSHHTGIGAIPVALGPRMLLASHCIVLAHAAMDARDLEP